MTAGAGVAAQILDRASGLRSGAIRRIADYIAIRQCAAALMALGVADALLPLSGRLRGLLLLWALATIALRWRSRVAGAAQNPFAVARFVESNRPELDNALIHAAQFSALLEANPDYTAAPLMRRELERAEQEAFRISHAEIVPMAPLRRERRRAQTALALALLSVFVFPRLWRFEMPRLLTFWRDNPPFTLTDFMVVPGSLRVPAGSGLTVTVRLDGPRPDALELVSAQDGEAPQSAPMLKLDDRTFSARMDNLSADAWYYVRGETGRSPRYLLQIAPAGAKRPTAPERAAAKQAAPQRPASQPDGRRKTCASSPTRRRTWRRRRGGTRSVIQNRATQKPRRSAGGRSNWAQKAADVAQNLKNQPENANEKSKLEEGAAGDESRRDRFCEQKRRGGGGKTHAGDRKRRRRGKRTGRRALRRRNPPRKRRETHGRTRQSAQPRPQRNAWNRAPRFWPDAHREKRRRVALSVGISKTDAGLFSVPRGENNPLFSCCFRVVAWVKKGAGYDRD